MSRSTFKKRHCLVKDASRTPGLSLPLTTTVLFYPHSLSICIMLENHLAAADKNNIYLDLYRGKKEMSPHWRPGCCESDRAKSCWGAEWCPDNGHKKKAGRFWIAMSTHPDRAQIWLFCSWQGSDFYPPTAPRIRRGYQTHMHARVCTHTQSRKWKTQLSQDEYIKCLHKPSTKQKTNLLCTACVIHQQVR